MKRIGMIIISLLLLGILGTYGSSYSTAYVPSYDNASPVIEVSKSITTTIPITPVDKYPEAITTKSIPSVSIPDNSTNSESTTTTSSITSTTTRHITTTTTGATSTTTKKITTQKTEKTTKGSNITTNTTKGAQLSLKEDEIRKKIMALEKIYPTGTSWTNENRKYVFKAVNKANYVGYGCAAFAFMASDVAFGTAAVKETYDFDNIRIGDIIRYNNNSHSVIVIDLLPNEIVVAEGNIHVEGYPTGIVYWGRKISRKEIKETGNYIYTRWP